MRIDAHLHFWRYQPAAMRWITPEMEMLARDWLPADAEPELRRQHMDGAIAVQSCSDEADTAFLMRLASTYSWITGVVGWVDLRAADCAARIDHWRAQGPLVGLRHQVQDEADPAAYLKGSELGVQAVQEAGLVYELLLKGEQLAAAAEFCQRHDRHTIVLDHLGKPPIRDGRAAFDAWRHWIRPLGALPHVVIKVSGLLTEAATDADGQVQADTILPYLDAVLDDFGPQRLMFGSDWPVCLLAAPPGGAHRLVADWSARLSEGERDALFGGVATDVYACGRYASRSICA